MQARQMIPDPPWQLRPAEPTDDAFLQSLYLQVHAHDFTAIPLPPEEIHNLLLIQARAQKLGYLRDYPNAGSFIVLIAGQSAGRLLMDWSLAALQLIDIALTPAIQGRGIGTQILNGLIAQAADRQLPLRLSVSPISPALRLYSRLGFQVTAGGVVLQMELAPNGIAGTNQSPAIPTEQAGSAFYSRLVHRLFRLDDSQQTLRLNHVDSFGPGSFALLFHGPLTPVLPQRMFSMHLLTPQGVPERTFEIFLVPVGPRGDAMQYEAVYNL